ncbi:MAG: hypothetical protein QG620_85 [Patescibacteria group bacterium]|nr:hypothetical protein [Patescibacteria group bacterium]
MKKLLAMSSVLLGVVFLAGCGQQQTSQTQSATPAPVAQQPATTQPPATQPGQTNNVTSVPSDWKTYSDQKYAYQFQYPNDWNLVGDSGSDPDGYNVTVWQGEGFNKDNIQIVKVMYGTNADGTINNRESYLKMLTIGNYSKISVAGGQGYYSVNETKNGPSPSVYLVGDKEIFLMNFNIFDSKKTSLASAEKLFKQVIGTFKFTN